MKELYPCFIGTTIGFVAGNYLYQLIVGSYDWSLAADRSIFVITTSATLALAIWIDDWIGT